MLYRPIRFTITSVLKYIRSDDLIIEKNYLLPMLLRIELCVHSLCLFCLYSSLPPRNEYFVQISNHCFSEAQRFCSIQLYLTQKLSFRCYLGRRPRVEYPSERYHLNERRGVRIFWEIGRTDWNNTRTFLHSLGHVLCQSSVVCPVLR